MPRPIWTGTLSFGLLNVPVSLMSGEKRTDIHFRMLDARDKAPIRYERVNADTGDEVPWKEIVKAYEYDKGSYVILEPEDIKAAAPESHESVEVEAFVDFDAIGPQYFEKPYILVPGKKAEKGYVLLRETLVATKKVGIARVVIRTREYLAAVMPQGKALVLLLLRYPQELVAPDDYKLPEGKVSDYRISAQELKMAVQLIESMSGAWKPGDYRDEFRKRLHDVIARRMKKAGAISKRAVDDDEPAEDKSTNVVDFMSLLQKSLATNKRTPAKKTVEKAVTTKAPAKAAAKRAVKKAPAAARKRKTA
jgi:DNA end-binding protein Ku